ncbi:N-acetylglucosamine-6-phosphate deacetylase [Salinisphaera hydrothermalis]|uniref:N-acetylglucosamine-6-phosphate deacetylase n=1 Tax=Salinisphaera hydrothermalis (strain C41B8) TaxID=1304275 RepID=A0A084IL73_SALHC|nr:N-acetylglucosamine-6-phosphate deacetylase [Salinisphaera hydrothermalis]KEZ77457.1 N-acetylglucosamine-6-phosphate deacetylase [Salinisphaera hydrothermalis C41B8]
MHTSTNDTPRRWQLRGARVHGGAADARAITIAGTRIDVPDADAPAIDLPADWHVVPGFIDAHIHGARGADVMDADADGLARIARYLPAEGTTSFLATTMTGPAAAIEAALRVTADFESAPGAAEMLGVHLEGPFVDRDKAGAQPAEHMIAPDIDRFDRWQAAAAGGIRVVTLAPEQPGGDALVAHLVRHGVRASIGHSSCSAAQAEAVIAAGANRGTHLFNAMNGLHHREPGAACALLTNPAARSEIIADGLHVTPAMVKLAYAAAGRDRLMAITDAMRAKGLGDGDYELGGQPVTVKNGEARLADGTLAGSVLTFDDAFRNLLDFTGCELADAIAMTSTNAAADLGVADRKGALAKGFDADLLVLDAELRVRLTVCRGRVAHDPEQRAIT